MRGKIIVIEGTDCSGKETQTRLLVDKLTNDGFKVKRLSVPMYDTPTGKIIGACLLGKPQMCEELLKDEHSFFPEGGGNIDALAACDLYAADRRYNLPKILKYLNDGYIVIIDRYVTSNMAHRGGLIKSKKERIKMYEKIELKEYVINELPKPDKTILLYESHKSLPWIINKITGIVESQATYDERDLAYLSTLFGINTNKDAKTSNMKRSRIRTCANTKLSSLKK